MGNPLWAPWRMEYILAPKDDKVCIFCGIDTASEEERRERLVVCTTPRACVMLNRYPFASGHLLVIPCEHRSTLEDLDDEVYDDLFRLVRVSTSKLRAALKPDGFNVGINLGASAGAGVAAHLHVHIVPRWSGDTNFMPVVADTRVIPQALSATRDYLEPYFRQLQDRPAGDVPSALPTMRQDPTP
jgi:ATP adenylyltransferase